MLWMDILGGLVIHLGIERRDKGYDGLVGDDSHLTFSLHRCYAHEGLLQNRSLYQSSQKMRILRNLQIVPSCSYA